MAFVQFSNVSLSFGEREILRDVSVNLSAGTKAALTGANGAGKSTLIKVMAGLIKPDSGVRTAEKNARVSYLPQSGLTHAGNTLREEADKAFDFGYKLQEELEKIGDELKKNPPNSAYLLERHDKILTELEDSGWNRRSASAEQVLTGLGFSKSDLDKRCEEFSGGWQMRIALAKNLMARPDILLLDEPTNYLDLEARNWLEGFLGAYKGGFLLVSHDRYFLDHTINEVYELFAGNLKRYAGNFTHYEQVREIEIQTLTKEYEKQQAEIKHLEDFINRFGAKATKAAQAQERQKMLNRLKENEIVIPQSFKRIHFKFPAAPHSGRLVATLSKITKSYDGKTNVINDLDLTIENGDRLVVAGVNGAGKSTLLKIISGVDANFSGEIKLGSGVSVGYFSQDNAETLRGNKTVLQEIEDVAPLELVPRLRDMLGAFLFHGDDVFKSLDVLSGGEKSRVALLKLLLRPVNFLILDEPTNHLDMHSKDVLLDALRDFGGTVIFVSHDRAFIESLSTRVLELKNGKWRLFPGNYEYYQSRLEAEAGNENAIVQKVEVKSEGKSSWQEQKKFEAEKRKAEKKVAELEEKIAACEEEKRRAEEEMARPDVYTNGEKAKSVQKKIDEIAKKIDELTQEWEKSAEEAESFAL